MVAVNLTLPLLAALAASPGRLGIVCARFKESLEPWAPVANNTYMYAKGSVPQTNDSVPHSAFRSYIPLRNIGREGHTHLYHIVQNYDTLDEVMVFSQADPFDLLAPAVNTTEQMVQRAMQVEERDVTPFNAALFHDLADWEQIDWNSSKQALWIKPSQIKTLQLAPYTPAQFWTRVMGGQHPPAIRAMHGGIFAVKRETIWSLPRTVYQNALDEFEKANSSNPEIGFFMERMWAPMFSQKYRLNSVQIP
ncbi:uncharacterized protein CTRU02_211874 [Colletotrichum truncatum]|uniref:Uncharacterized protein n=1 Tax=Colletotrichum truncatum TaxID=5467 RepID=A0ACC3YLY9_COLTU|nr:uncharacterized protein CTRU02_07284 [Colletotrichum truncatum]KAF6791522.1 hypothetical protein CTRU02_07284 [Colletotrichum truncatum]